MSGLGVEEVGRERARDVKKRRGAADPVARRARGGRASRALHARCNRRRRVSPAGTPRDTDATRCEHQETEDGTECSYLL
jgi:hypothetical protein